MSPQRFDTVLEVVMGVLYLFIGGFMAVALTVIMVRHSSYPFVFLFIATGLAGMALCGVWMLWTTILAPPSDGEEEGEAGKGPRRRRPQPARPGKRPRRGLGPKPGLAGGPA